MEADATITRERDRCLEAIKDCPGCDRIDMYKLVLDDFIRWSLQRPQLVHEVHPNGVENQDTLKFVLRENGQVLWEVFPRKADGAKLIAFPKPSFDYPEAVRAEVRRLWAAIDGGKENSGNGEARLSLRLLFREASRHQAQAALDWALAARTRATS